MPDQNYSNHRQYVPIYHYVVLPVLFLTIIGSIVNLIESWGDHTRLYSASLIVVLAVASFLMLFLLRVFALKAQDRAIRAEENLRHFAMTGRLLDARLTVRQVVGLRFASDGEFVALAQRAAAENLTEDAIKRAIKTWRPDTYRV
jgi:L-cystine uptake protein TcyP (sodium:dicarboxylate symporter family)